MRGSFMLMRLNRPHKRLGGFLAAAGSRPELQEKVTAASERHQQPPCGGDSVHRVMERVRASGVCRDKGC